MRNMLSIMYDVQYTCTVTMSLHCFCMQYTGKSDLSVTRGLVPCEKHFKTINIAYEFSDLRVVF